MTYNEVQIIRKNSTDRQAAESLSKSDPKFAELWNTYKSKYESEGDFFMDKTTGIVIDKYFERGQRTSPTTPLGDSLGKGIIENEKRIKKKDRVPREGALDFVGDAASFAGETLLNVPGSAIEFGTNLASAVTSPIETVGALGSAAIGGVVNAAEMVAGTEDIIDIPQEEIASKIGEFYVERYGSTKDALETLKTDPVGFLADVSGFLGLAGISSRLAGLSSLTSKVSQASKITDPVRIATTPVRGVQSLAGKAFSPERLIHTTLKLKPNQITKISKKNIAGKSPGKWLAEKGISGTPDEIVDDLGKIHTSSKALVDETLASIPDEFSDVASVQKGLAILDDLYSGATGLEDDVAAIRALASKSSHNLTEINQIKRLLSDADIIFARSGGEKTGAAAKGAEKVRAALQKFVEEKALDIADVDVGPINKNTQVSKEIIDAIENSADTQSVRRFLTLGSTEISVLGGVIGGAAGGGVGATIGAGTLFILNRIRENPALRTKLAINISRLTPSDASIVTKALKTGSVSSEARLILQSLLRQSGFIDDDGQ